MARMSKGITREVLKKSFTAFFALFLFGGGYIFYRTKVQPVISAELYEDLKKYIASIFVLCIAFVIHRIADAALGWYKQKIAAKTKTLLDDKLVPIFKRTVKVAIWVTALLVILPFYGVNISALITALGVSSLAIALAAQDTIANVIAGFLIMVDTPFVEGDRIKLPSGEIVEVLDIGVRRSKFLSEDKAIVIVPNVDLSKSKIVNYTSPKPL